MGGLWYAVRGKFARIAELSHPRGIEFELRHGGSHLPEKLT
jgi:hypothetical protein